MPQDCLVSHLMLSCGTLYTGLGFGLRDVAAAELCFTTGTLGYQHTISDPSFASQIAIFTFPHIGNIGINYADSERDQIFIKGVVFKNPVVEGNHYMNKLSLDSWFKENNIVGLYDIDTRRLVRHIVKNGMQNAVIFPSYVSKEEAWSKLSELPNMEGTELTQKVSIEKSLLLEKRPNLLHPEIKVAIVDFGFKNSIINLLSEFFEICIIKAKQGFYQEILQYNVYGVVLSNGPGDPAATFKQYAKNDLEALIMSEMPIMGVCLGHQLLALTLGCKTHKLAHAHRGINHPVYNVFNNSVEISSQNHGFVVSNESIPDNVIVTHYSLFDKSIEGLTVRNKPIFSVQFHPESSPGPNDSKYIFKKFANEVTSKKHGHSC